MAAATASDTLFQLSADASFVVMSLSVGDRLLINTELVIVFTAASSSRPTLITVTRHQNEANGVATVSDDGGVDSGQY